VMVPNPSWHAAGDFVLAHDALREPADAGESDGERLTFGNIGVYRPSFLHGETPGRFKLLPLYQRAMRAGQASGERYDGFWRNLGNPQQLAELDAQLRAAATHDG